MAFGSQETRTVEKFLAEIAPWNAAYPYVTFSGVALYSEGEWHLYSGRAVLTEFEQSTNVFQTNSILAFRLSEELEFSSAALTLERYLSTGIPVEDKLIRFYPRDSGNNRYSANTRAYSDAWPNSQARTTALDIHGQRLEKFRMKGALDLELMAAQEPFSSFAELLSEFGLADPSEEGGYLEIVAFAPCGFDPVQSLISNGQAKINLKASPKLSEELFSIGVQILHAGSTKRLSIQGSSASWRLEDGIRVGTFELSVPPASVLKLFSRYDGHIQTYYWLADPETSPNPRRMIHEIFDPDLGKSKAMFGKDLNNSRDSREFELALSWLFWMLGFSPLYWGAAQKTSDAPDLVVISKNGSVLVIEATTGVLQAGGKLTKLVSRTQKVRVALERAHSNVVVLPVLCTTSSDEEISTDIAHAQNHGVAVVSARYLQGMLESSYFIPDSDKIVGEFLKALENWREKKSIVDGGEF